MRIIRATLLLGPLLGGLGCEAQPEGRELGLAPRSLDGTEIDGGFHFDADGELVLDEDARRAFDYFLTAGGELSPDELEAWVGEQVAAALADDLDARARVMDAWTRYVAFRAEAAAALEDPRAVEQPERVEQRLLLVLDEQLGGTPLAAVERQRVEQAFELRAAYVLDDPELRAAELARLGADEAGRFAASRAGRYLAGRQAVEQAREAGADAETLTALRVEHFDAIEPGAAERLAELDARRAAWAERVAAFRTERELLREGFVGAPAALEQAIDALEREHFSAAERRRVQALDAIAEG